LIPGGRSLKRSRIDDKALGLFPELDVEPVAEKVPKPKRPHFFEAQRTASAVKTKIVVDYFRPWANIMKFRTRSGKIGYFDFFCGPGIYADGTESTPVQITRIVLGDERLCKTVRMLFEDKDPAAVESLARALESLDGYDRLEHKPILSKGESARREIEEFFRSKAIIPTLMFLDPFGYVGLTQQLIRAILKDWGCDVLFYLNFNRIIGALSHPNPKIGAHMQALFGADRVREMRDMLGRHPDEAKREQVVVSAVRNALREGGGEYVLTFGFRNKAGKLDHHLVFSTKNLDPAQKIMKGIMSRASSIIDADGVGNFEFDAKLPEGQQPALLGEGRQLEELKGDLLSSFAGRKLRVIEVYEEKEKGCETPFTIKNYQDALRELAYDDKVVRVEKGGFLVTESSVSRRHMHEQYDLTFPI
jgi:three-Cys-motif partner protein